MCVCVCVCVTTQSVRKLFLSFFCVVVVVVRVGGRKEGGREAHALTLARKSRLDVREGRRIDGDDLQIYIYIKNRI